MNSPRSSSGCAILAALCFLLGASGPVQGQNNASVEDRDEAAERTEPRVSAPQADSESVKRETLDEAEEDGEEDKEEITVTLTVTTDSECTVYVTGGQRKKLEPGTSIDFDVPVGAVEIVATAEEAPAARWKKEIEAVADKPQEIEVEMLSTIEALRRTERRESVWRDIDRGFMWTSRDNARDVTWKVAHEYCSELQLGGFDNWQIPTLDQLESIEAMWSQRPFKTVDPILMTSCCAWSADTVDASTAFNFNYRFRRAFESHKSLALGFRALCIREMPADELAEAVLAADPKEIKRRAKEKEERLAARKGRRAAKKKKD